MIIEVTEGELHAHVSAQDGVCLNCGEWQEGVESDAENRICTSCGEDDVVGAEQAVLLGAVSFTEVA